MATGKKGKKKKEKIWQHGALSLRKVSAHSCSLCGLPSHSARLLAAQRGPLGTLFERVLTHKQRIKSVGEVWWDESDCPSHNPKEPAARMEKQATLKEKVNRIKNSNFAHCHPGCHFFVCALAFYCPNPPPMNITFNLLDRKYQMTIPAKSS